MLTTKPFSAGENAGAAAAGRPACVFQVTDEQRVSRLCFTPPRSFLQKGLLAVSSRALTIVIFTFSVVIGRLTWGFDNRGRYQANMVALRSLLTLHAGHRCNPRR